MARDLAPVMSALAPPIRWVFLDRDGTINLAPPPGRYVAAPAELELLPGAVEAIRLLNRSGIWTAVVTNQRGIAKGLMSERDLEAVHERLRQQLADGGAHLDAIYHCPHEQDRCDCRKPRPGMLLRAQSEHPGLRFSQAAMVGDSESDVRAGLAAGACAVLLADRAPGSCAEHVAPTLLDAVEWLLATREPGCDRRSGSR